MLVEENLIAIMESCMQYHARVASNMSFALQQTNALDIFTAVNSNIVVPAEMLREQFRANRNETLYNYRPHLAVAPVPVSAAPAKSVSVMYQSMATQIVTLSKAGWFRRNTPQATSRPANLSGTYRTPPVTDRMDVPDWYGGARYEDIDNNAASGTPSNVIRFVPRRSTSQRHGA